MNTEEQRNYYHFSGLENVYLEDSYVLDIEEDESSLAFLLDIVLTEDHPRYRPPKPNEQYCYRQGRLVFSEARAIRWLEKNMRPYTDASGTKDFGNIDTMIAERGRFRIEGDWGKVEVEAPPPTLSFIEGAEADHE